MNAETALHNYLNRLNYSIDARPLYNSSAPIVVWMALRLFKIVEFSSEERLVVMATMMTGWKDEFMVWDPEKYGGIEIIYRRADTMWRCSPFTLWNSASNYVYYTLNGSHPITLQYDGSIAMDITSTYTVVCEMDVTYFPWDTQHCQIQIKPSVMDIQHLVIVPVTGVNLMASADPSNTQWKVQSSGLLHYTKAYNVLNGLYFSTNQSVGYKTMTIYFLNITLSRMPTYYVYNVIAPVCIITGLSLLSYLIPGSSGERIGLTVSAFLSFSVFQSYVNDFVPRAATIPMLTIYIVSQMVLSSICVLSGVIALLLNDVHHQMPASLQSVVYTVARCLCVNVKEKDVCNRSDRTQHSNSKNDEIADMHALATHVVLKSSIDFAASVNNRALRTVNFNSLESSPDLNVSNSDEPSDGAFRRNVMPNATPAAVGVTKSEPRSTCNGKRNEWLVLNDVVNRIVSVLCFSVIVFLTTFFLITMQTDGRLQ